VGERLERFFWLVNTILKPQVYQMVLRRLIEPIPHPEFTAS
jgi:hypothetical protein